MAVHAVFDCLCQPGANLGQIAVADRLNEQFAQWSSLELQLASTSNT